MNSTLQLLLRLQELDLLRHGLVLAGPFTEAARFDFLEEKAERVRREIPGAVLSQYDALARQHAEPVAAASWNLCRGCGGAISARLVSQLEHSNQLQRCPRCGRFLYDHEKAPDYVDIR